MGAYSWYVIHIYGKVKSIRHQLETKILIWVRQLNSSKKSTSYTSWGRTKLVYPQCSYLQTTKLIDSTCIQIRYDCGIGTHQDASWTFWETSGGIRDDFFISDLISTIWQALEYGRIYISVLLNLNLVVPVLVCTAVHTSVRVAQLYEYERT